MSKEDILMVDISICSEFEISVNELFAIINIYKDDDSIDFDDAGVDYDRLQDNKFLKIISDNRGEHIILRKKGVDLIDTVLGRSVMLKKKPSRREVDIDLITRLPEFRSKWKGLKPGAMGSLKSCRDKLIRWMNENPEYTFDEILKAADAYIESLDGDYRFLQRADYFIYKQENNREESSRLSAFIDEEGASGQKDWTTQLI